MNIIEIYTDGSCHTQERVGGWAAVILIDEEEVILQGSETDTTHNRMELLAVIKSLEYIEEQKLDIDKVRIYSDSQYVVRIEERREKLQRQNFITKAGKELQNTDLIKELIVYIESMTPEFIKVKAHQKKTDIRNINIEVDKLSRKIVRNNIKGLNN